MVKTCCISIKCGGTYIFNGNENSSDKKFAWGIESIDVIKADSFKRDDVREVFGAKDVGCGLSGFGSRFDR